MKILHTADWHLGKRLDRFSRIEEQIDVMNEIITIADDQNVDLILVAGDLFDAFNPAVDAVELFFKTVKRLSKNGARPVIAIGGNHDSPDRIDAPEPLARECGIILIGYPQALIDPFTLEQFKITKSAPGFIELEINEIDFPIRILHTAFANEIRLKSYFGEDKETALNTILKTHWHDVAAMYCDESGVNVLMTHLYMNKRGTELLEEPEGEKPLKIGTADLVYTDCIPAQIQYTALGHLHAHHNIGTVEKPIVYASSPLCYSFSEAGQTKYVSILDVQPNQPATYQKIRLTKGKILARKTFNSVNDTVTWLSENKNALVEITLVSETFITADERKSIYQTHDGIVHLIPKVKTALADESEAKQINLNQNIHDLFQDYFKTKNANQAPNEELMHLFNEILNK